MKKRAVILTAGAFLLLIGACTKTPLQPEVDPDKFFGMSVENFSAVYDKEMKQVELKWDEPANKEFVSFYRIYRSTWSEVEYLGDDIVLRPDTSADAFVSDGPRTHIPRDKTSFTDLLSPATGTYWYGIKPVRVVGQDTTEGRLSRLVPAQVSTGVLFSINGGSVYTATDHVELVIIDQDKTVESVEFTQKYTPMLEKGDQRIEFPWDDPDNLPTVDQLNAAKDYLSGHNLANQVSQIRVPDFDAHDPENPNRGPFNLDDAAVFRTEWVLEKGNGEKNVWARIVYKEDSDDEIKHDNIKIAPWGNDNYIRLRLENKSSGIDRTMRQTDRYYDVYRPWVRFSVSIFSDSTVEPEFYYWLALPHKAADFQTDQINPRSYNWIETLPKKGMLTGRGSTHDDGHVYNFFLQMDSLAARGETDLMRQARITTEHLPKTAAFPLTFGDKLNERAVPGSYYGENPGKVVGSAYESVQRVLSGEPREVLDTLFHLGSGQKDGESNDRYGQGKKEFYLFALFRGKYFKDTRVAVLYGEDFYANTEGKENKAYFDLVPPTAFINVQDNAFFNNGATLGETFSYALQKVQDRGKAAITKIELAIARKPESMPWDASVNPYSMTPADLLSMNGSDVFPYEILVEQDILHEIEWNDIDASRWESGEYIMGVITADEFGNEGFAPMTTGQTNPWLVTIQTGL